MLSTEFIKILKKNDINFFTGIPDSLMKNFLMYLNSKKYKFEHYVAANEGSAIGLGIGYHLSTKKVPLIYLQNSGLGNCVNPIVSLADREVFSIPLVLLIGWRGEKGLKDEPQHKKQGKITEQLIRVLDIPYIVLDEKIKHNEISNLIKNSKKNSKPVALLVKKNFFQIIDVIKNLPNRYPLNREEVISLIINNLSDKDIVVSTTGMASRELLEIKKMSPKANFPNFMTIGGMGHASQIALGIALKNKKRRVICIDGDGSIIMHMGGMSTIGSIKPSNFMHIVINNGVHGSVGNQPTDGMKINLKQIARGCGYENVFSSYERKTTNKKIKDILKSNKCSFLEVRVNTNYRKDLIRPDKSPKFYKENLIKKLIK